MPVTKPYPVRMERDLLKVLRDGTRRTPHKKQELIRITLRRYLPRVIEEESVNAVDRITNIEPWPKGLLEKAYKKAGNEWDKIEEFGIASQGKPDYND